MSSCYQIVRDRDGYAWRLIAGDGTAIARSANHFNTKVGADQDIRLFKQVVSDADTAETEDVSSDTTT
jgi:uncharacterized protein YegP (UPF0339 family)